MPSVIYKSFKKSNILWKVYKCNKIDYIKRRDISENIWKKNVREMFAKNK